MTDYDDSQSAESIWYKYLELDVKACILLIFDCPARHRQHFICAYPDAFHLPGLR
jgi:hypothetical protein